MSLTVRLNVGGKRYETTADTLRGSKFFVAMLTGPWRESAPEREIFVDRDGKTFRGVLNFLRNPTSCPPLTREILEEFDFFGIEVGTGEDETGLRPNEDDEGGAPSSVLSTPDLDRIRETQDSLAISFELVGVRIDLDPKTRMWEFVIPPTANESVEAVWLKFRLRNAYLGRHATQDEVADLLDRILGRVRVFCFDRVVAEVSGKTCRRLAQLRPADEKPSLLSFSKRHETRHWTSVCIPIPRLRDFGFDTIGAFLFRPNDVWAIDVKCHDLPDWKWCDAPRLVVDTVHRQNRRQIGDEMVSMSRWCGFDELLATPTFNNGLEATLPLDDDVLEMVWCVCDDRQIPLRVRRARLLRLDCLGCDFAYFDCSETELLHRMEKRDHLPQTAIYSNATFVGKSNVAPLRLWVCLCDKPDGPVRFDLHAKVATNDHHLFKRI